MGTISIVGPPAWEPVGDASIAVINADNCAIDTECSLMKRDGRRRIRSVVREGVPHELISEEQPHPDRLRVPPKPAVVKRKGSASDVVAALLP